MSSNSSITYKVKLNGGDIKSVQGDSGHAQAKMVTNQYSHIIDDDRKYNAELFEEAFYGKKEVEDVEIDSLCEFFRQEGIEQISVQRFFAL